MIKDLIILKLGIFIGVVMVIVIYCIDCPKQTTEVKENMSLLRPPRELPKEIEFDEIKIPTNLTEVIL